ncbi:phosphatidate cytidylyltransferase [Coraliomargarita sp. SDUM461004]|uniref:Phosphatidate cytidylyltransferase n=1 Tax=Thalassobacterium sedimentorum TaxID=3041258 RepID=A0ABU1AEM8_9BACT|nr:phosphatidate cytidylyltransferase [Coraliomargarita sp. SDUM461004]MDQ8193087.1 phosphatidate cytidylyltransferase [Coraliomargarita sp. SDUM461004]
MPVLSIDSELGAIIVGVVLLLSIASIIGYVLAQRTQSDKSKAVIDNLNARIRAWWFMVLFFGLAVLSGNTGSIILFALISFLALREFITLTPTSRGDHRTLFWAFFIITPLHYFLIWIHWYGLFSILIPVYAALVMPIRNATTGDTKDFLARTAKVQWALMVCVYFVSYAPALLTLKIPGYEGQNAKLLLFLVLVVQMSDVLQYVWGKLTGKRKIVPQLSPNKTVEGFIGGVLSASLLGGALCWMTPFNFWQATLLAFLICLMGFFGGLVMSGIKRDRNIKDFGTLIQGHGGILDRIDSICFSAPLFFHLVRFYFAL